MNTYSRAMRHIDMKDVKQKHQEKIIEKQIKEERKIQEDEYILSVLKEKESNWRLDLFG
jgi:hypothetical protein